MGICSWGSLPLGEDRKEFYERLRRRVQEAEEATGGWRSTEALKKSYQKADPDTMLRIMNGA